LGDIKKNVEILKNKNLVICSDADVHHHQYAWFDKVKIGVKIVQLASIVILNGINKIGWYNSFYIYYFPISG